MRYPLIAAALILAASTPLQAQQVAPLQVQDVIDLAGLGGSQEAKIDLIESSCIAFPVDDATISRLRSNGVSEVMIETLRTACFAGAELVVESQPPGAEVLLDQRTVGRAPWTGRFADGRSVSVAVRSGGRTLSSSANLQPGMRTRAAFAFTEDTVPLPRTRSVVEIARDLNLEQRWQPPTPMPTQPSRPGRYGGFPALVVNLAAAAAGAQYCGEAENYCYIDPIYEDDGTDSMEPVRYLAGAGAGLIVGMVANSVIGKVVNTVRDGMYERSVAQREAWVRRDQAARAEWIATHPELVRERSAEQEARAAAEAQNAQIRERNRAVVPSRVTTERLPGPDGR